MELQILLLSLTVASAVNLNCAPQTSVCDGEEVVCNCTALCNETIHWWDNKTISFCSRTQLCNGNRELCIPDTSPPVHVEVINCSSTDIFTSRLSYNASLSTSRNIQIGCSSSRINNNTCSPEEPLDSDSVILPVRNCTGRNLMSTPTVQPPTDLNPTPTSTPTAQPPTTGLNPTSTPTAQPPTNNGGINIGAVVGGVVSALVIIAIILVIGLVIGLVYWKLFKKGACKKSSNGTKSSEKRD